MKQALKKIQQIKAELDPSIYQALLCHVLHHDKAAIDFILNY